MKQAIASQKPKEDPKMPGQMSKFLAKPAKPKNSENKSPASLEAILEKRRKDEFEVVWVKGKGS